MTDAPAPPRPPLRLWLLQPTRTDKGNSHRFWTPWYDKAFGFVVRAANEADARILAATEHGDEGEYAWLDATASTCVELTANGMEEVVLRDFSRA